MLMNIQDERANLWKRLEKHKKVLNYKRQNDYRRYNLYLEDGLVKIEPNHGHTEFQTIDSTLYIWLESGDTPERGSPNKNGRR